ncbi:MAG: polysaccharide biosynthesis tyrosine autokinase [Planctomycetaceae bacterium]
MNEYPSHSENTSESAQSDVVQEAMRLLRVIWHRKGTVAGALVVAACLGALYFLSAVRIYESKAQLLVTQSSPDMVNGSTAGDGVTSSLIPTYEGLLSSPVVVEGAIKRLQKLPGSARVDFNSIPVEKWPKVLKDHLTVDNPRKTNMLQVRYRSQSPEAATSVVQSLIDSYLEFMERNHKDVSAEIMTVLDAERIDVDQRIADKEQELLQMKFDVQDLGLRNGTNVVHPAVQAVVQINNSLVEVQQQRLQHQAALSIVQQTYQNGGDLRQHLIEFEPTLGRELLTSALGLDPESLKTAANVEQQILQEQAKLDSYRDHYGPRHPKIIELQRSISNSQQYLIGLQRRGSERLANLQQNQLGPMLIDLLQQKVASLIQHEQNLLWQYNEAQTQAVALSGRMAKLEISEHELDRLRINYESLLNRIESIDMHKNRANVRVTVVGDPQSDGSPVSPRLTVVAFLVLLVGGGFGSVMAYVLDRLDDRFRSPDELRAELGLPVLAIIRQLPPSTETGPNSLELHAHPQAPHCEPFRTLRTTLAMSIEGRELLAITSSEPGDGKTTVMSNLGVAFAQAGRRTLLIDADLRRPGLSKKFDVRGMEGLSQVLTGHEETGAHADRLIVATGIPNLDILPCGSRPLNPAELLSSVRMSELVAWGETHYDQVLIDCPPILAASDASIVARYTGNLMLVVQPAKNPRRAVIHAAAELERMQTNVIGLVVNRADEDKKREFYGYGMDYDYREESDESDEFSSSATRDNFATPSREAA